MQVQESLPRLQVMQVLKNGSRSIAPLWSLENFVAVNAYQGLSDMSFSRAMDFLSKNAQASGTLPVSYYLELLKNGRISKEDLAQALEDNKFGLTRDVDEFLIQLFKSDEEAQQHVQTFGQVAGMYSGKRWDRFMVDRISFWASAHFDKKQALWDTSSSCSSLYTAWKTEAEIDVAPEVMGLKGFRNFIKGLPDHFLDAAEYAMETLQLSDKLQETYLNALLLKMNGWAGFAARIDWDAGLENRESHVLQEFLSILLVWEMAIKELVSDRELDLVWENSKGDSLSLIDSTSIHKELSERLILQEAFDIAQQKNIIGKINSQQLGEIEATEKPPTYQMVFCIDVRSEVLRRNIEALSDDVETLGFAGFFGFPIEHVPLGHEEGHSHCPVLISPTHKVKEQLRHPRSEEKAVLRRRLGAQVRKAVKAFKKGAVSCFGFVSPLGVFFLPKLVGDAFGWSRPIPKLEKVGLTLREVAQKNVNLALHMEEHAKGISLADRINMGLSALKAMSLTERFAPVVLLTGHGSTSTNNPHASGLDCGACGGHSGEANAKVAAAVLNDIRVRDALEEHRIFIPKETLFVAALHDTATDSVTLFDTPSYFHAPIHDKYLYDLSYTLKLAGEKTRSERATRMNITGGNIQNKVLNRSSDWSQIRPEWGLAGCSSFIVAPRERTAQLNLEGRAFMHNYSWKKDKYFGVLEVIMTAPMVVTSWINLQYYASTVDNKVFGSGNKTLHNVVGGVGVLEGFGGDLQVGLPLQSVHDGKKYQHEPARLNVIIEAPVDEMSRIIGKHKSIKRLLDNQWIFLFAINEQGKVAYKYLKNLEWEVV